MPSQNNPHKYKASDSVLNSPSEDKILLSSYTFTGASLNARSAVKSARELANAIVDHTWFHEGPTSILFDLVPPNYSIIAEIRLGGGRGLGVAIIYCSGL